jgi:hypothetical protein
MAAPIIHLETIISSLASNTKLSDEKVNDKTLATFAIEPTSLATGVEWAANTAFLVTAMSAIQAKDNVVGKKSNFFDTEIYKEETWLRYRLLANAKVLGNFSAFFSKFAGLPIDKFGGSAGANFAISTYKVHQKDDLLSKALLADKSNIVVVFDKNSLKNLQNNEALTFQTQGNLAFGVEVKFSDLLFSAFEQVKDLQKIAFPKNSLSLQAEAAINFTFDIGITDSFEFTICRKDENYLFAVAKSFDQNIGFSAGAGITMGLTNPRQLNKAIDAVIQKFVPTDLAQIDALFSKALADAKILTKEDKESFVKIAKILGLTGSLTDLLTFVPKIKQLQTDWLAWVNKIKGEIHKVVESKVKIGVKASYQKTYQKSKLLRGKATSLAALQANYADILGFDFENLIKQNDKQNNKEIIIEEFMLKTNVKSSLTIGLEISLFNWVQLGISNQTVKKFTETTQYQGQNLLSSISFDAKRELQQYYGVKDKINGSSYFSQFSIESIEPTIGNITNKNTLTTLELGFEWKQVALDSSADEARIGEMIDLAYLWNIESLMLNEEEKAKLFAYFKDSKLQNHKFAFSYVADDTAWELLMQKLVLNKGKKLKEVLKTDIALRNALIQSFSGAMFYDKAFKAKQNFELRTQFYSAAWIEFFKVWLSNSIAPIEAMQIALSRLGKQLEILDKDLFEKESFELVQDQDRARLVYLADLFSTNTTSLFQDVIFNGFQTSLEAVQNLATLNIGQQNIRSKEFENYYGAFSHVLDSDFELRIWSRFFLLYLKENKDLIKTNFKYYQADKEVILQIAKIVGREIENVNFVV